MLNGNGTANFDHFKENLAALNPALDAVALRSTVIWMSQYPAIDFFGPLNSHEEVFSEKIHNYNLASERILRLVFVLTKHGKPCFFKFFTFNFKT